MIDLFPRTGRTTRAIVEALEASEKENVVLVTGTAADQDRLVRQVYQALIANGEEAGLRAHGVFEVRRPKHGTTIRVTSTLGRALGHGGIGTMVVDHRAGEVWLSNMAPPWVQQWILDLLYQGGSTTTRQSLRARGFPKERAEAIEAAEEPHDVDL